MYVLPASYLPVLPACQRYGRAETSVLNLNRRHEGVISTAQHWIPILGCGKCDFHFVGVSDETDPTTTPCSKCGATDPKTTIVGHKCPECDALNDSPEGDGHVCEVCGFGLEPSLEDELGSPRVGSIRGDVDFADASMLSSGSLFKMQPAEEKVTELLRALDESRDELRTAQRARSEAEARLSQADAEVQGLRTQLQEVSCQTPPACAPGSAARGLSAAGRRAQVRAAEKAAEQYAGVLEADLHGFQAAVLELGKDKERLQASWPPPPPPAPPRPAAPAGPGDRLSGGQGDLRVARGGGGGQEELLTLGETLSEGTQPPPPSLPY